MGIEGRRQPSCSVGNREGAPPAREPGGGGMCAFATRLATREGIDTTLTDQRSPYQLPGVTHCHASDLKVSWSWKEAMPLEHVHLSGDSSGLEVYGLLNAGTFEPM